MSKPIIIDKVSKVDEHFMDEGKHITTAERIKWNSAETNAINFSASRGVGGAVQIAGGTDLNNLVEQGLYIYSSGDGLGNAPMAGASYIEVINREGNQLPTQFLYPVYQNRIFTRARKTSSVGGAWTPWVEVVTEGNINSLLGDVVQFDDYLYCIHGNGSNKFYRYSISSNTWTTLAGLPWISGNSTYNTGGSLTRTGEYIYATRGARSESFARYDISSNKWEELADLPNYVAGGITF